MSNHRNRPRLEELLQIPDEEQINDVTLLRDIIFIDKLSDLKERLQDYGIGYYPSKEYKVTYKQCFGEKISDEEIKKRSGILRVGFNSDIIDNSINLIPDCLYTDDPKSLVGKELYGSLKHSADKYIHPLAFNLRNEYYNLGKTIGIVILADCDGIPLQEGCKENPYFLLEGFPASKWFSGLVLENNDNIYNLVMNEVIKYLKASSKFMRTKPKLFINRNHHSTKYKPTLALVEAFKSKYKPELNLDLLDTFIFKNYNNNNDTFNATHYMRKKTDPKIENIHYMHTWKKFRDLFQNVGLEKIINKINNQEIRKKLETRTHRDLQIKRGAWSECEGLVRGFEVDLKRDWSKDPLKMIYKNKTLSLIVLLGLGGIYDYFKEEEYVGKVDRIDLIKIESTFKDGLSYFFKKQRITISFQRGDEISLTQYPPMERVCTDTGEIIVKHEFEIPIQKCVYRLKPEEIVIFNAKDKIKLSISQNNNCLKKICFRDLETAKRATDYLTTWQVKTQNRIKENRNQNRKRFLGPNKTP